MPAFIPKPVSRDSQIALTPLANKTVAILGYGNQGRPQALNLRDSNIRVVVGCRDVNSQRALLAKQDGFEVFELGEAVAKSAVIMLLLPDEVMATVFEQSILPALKPGSSIGFAHGLAVYEGWLKFPADVDVFLLAPKGQGKGVRGKYLMNSGVPGLYAVHQDASGEAELMALAYGKAIGCSRVGLLPTTFEEETVCDLFSEQAVLCGGLTQLITAAFETLVEAGYAPEIAYFECLYEVKLVADLLHEKGINGMRQGISSTALFGDVLQGEKVIDGHVRETMRQTLQQIQTGAFSQALLTEFASGRTTINHTLACAENSLIEEVHRYMNHQIF
jgi:ketol-acid reductoisomerase